MASKKNLGIAVPILTRRCERCGKFFAACHPKDTQVLCERCRKDDRQMERASGRTCGDT